MLWYLSRHGWTPETWEYEVIALNLLEKQEFSYPHLHTNYRSYVGPVFPFLCFLLHLIWGKGLFLYMVFHLSVALTTIWLTYRLACRWFTSRTGMLAGLFAALEPGLVVYNSYKVDVLTLAICLLLVGLAVFDRVMVTGRYWWSALLGGLVGMAVMTRLDLIAILAPFVVWLALVGLPRRAVLMHSLLAVGMMLLVVMPWLARNYILHGRVLLTTTSGEQLWISNHENVTGSLHPDDIARYLEFVPPSIQDAVARGTELEQYDAFRTEAIRVILDDPAGFLRRAAVKFVYFWWFTPTYGWFYQDIPGVLRNAYKVLYAVLLVLAVLGAWTAWKSGDTIRWLPASSALAVILTVVLIHSIYFVEGRHRVLVMPLFLMFSALGVHALSALATRWRCRSLGHLS